MKQQNRSLKDTAPETLQDRHDLFKNLNLFNVQNKYTNSKSFP